MVEPVGNQPTILTLVELQVLQAGDPLLIPLVIWDPKLSKVSVFQSCCED